MKDIPENFPENKLEGESPSIPTTLTMSHAIWRSKSGDDYLEAYCLYCNSFIDIPRPEAAADNKKRTLQHEANCPKCRNLFVFEIDKDTFTNTILL